MVGRTGLRVLPEAPLTGHLQRVVAVAAAVTGHQSDRKLSIATWTSLKNVIFLEFPPAGAVHPPLWAGGERFLSVT